MQSDAQSRFIDFYPRPLRGGRRANSGTEDGTMPISIHALCEEGDCPRMVISQNGTISIHALCEEGDSTSPVLTAPGSLFLSTPSARRATRRYRRTGCLHLISIHALCEEGDPHRPDQYAGRRGFLSTPSARRATCTPHESNFGTSHFYPRPLRGGRPLRRQRPQHRSEISIHALCEEGDFIRACICRKYKKFLSTPSARRATSRPGRNRATEDNFYPRPLRGGRQSWRCCFGLLYGFLSTPSARRATRRMGTAATGSSNFYPRPLRGGRQSDRPSRHPGFPISIHALCEEGDRNRHRQG